MALWQRTWANIMLRSAYWGPGSRSLGGRCVWLLLHVGKTGSGTPQCLGGLWLQISVLRISVSVCWALGAYFAVVRGHLADTVSGLWRNTQP